MRTSYLYSTLVFFCVCCVSISSIAQNTFYKSFFRSGGNTEAYSVDQTTDGGFIICGTTSISGVGGKDVFLVKTDNYGDTLWTKVYGGTGNDSAACVKQTSDGGYFIAGSTNSFGNSTYDAYFIRTDANGDTLWTRTLGGGVNNEKANYFQQTADSGFIITGEVNSASSINEDLYFIKMDYYGDTLWTKIIGGYVSENGYAVEPTMDGGYIIAGRIAGIGAGHYDMYIIKTDSTGNPVWDKIYGGSSDDFAYSIKQTTDGGYIVAGANKNTGFIWLDACLVKLDSLGDTLWVKSYGGSNVDVFRSVQQTSDGGYIATGSTYNTTTNKDYIYVVKTDANGDTLWTKSYGGANGGEGYSIQQTTDGGYVIAGMGYVQISSCIYFIKTDGNGNSGCNQQSQLTQMPAPVLQIGSPAIIISSGGIINNPPSLMGNSGAAVTTFCFSVGTDEVMYGIPFTIFPNPCYGSISINLANELVKKKVEVFNIYGVQVYSENNTNAADGKIEIKNLSAGIYFARLSIGNKVYSSRIIVL